MDVRWNWFRGGRNYFFRKWRPPRSLFDLFIRCSYALDSLRLEHSPFPLRSPSPLPPGCSTDRLCRCRRVLFLTVTWELNSVLWVYIYIYIFSGTSESLEKWWDDWRSRVSIVISLEYFKKLFVSRFGVY